MIPIVEYFRANPATTPYCILPDISIASHGGVRSIQLFSRVPVQKIQRIALDRNSRSSVALLKILLAEKYQVSPAFTTCAPSVNPSTALENRKDPPFDAVLLIGDSALKHLGSTEYCVDLGEVWHKLTGLPFVYACWVAREETDLGEVPQILLEAKTRGPHKSRKSHGLKRKSWDYRKRSAVPICKIASNMIWMNLQLQEWNFFISML